MTEFPKVDLDDTQTRRRRRAILEGDLAAVTLPDTFSFISMIRKTGRLVIRQAALERNIYWNDGEIVFASSNSAEDSLGRFLLRNGKISNEQFDESKRRLTPELRHGKLLVQMGFLSPKDLWWGVKNQVLEILYALFAWKSGTFSFFEGPLDLQERITLSINTSSIIMEGIRRMDETARIKEKITSLELIFQQVPGAAPNLEELDLTPTEMNIFHEIDGARTIRDLIGMHDLTEFDVSRILFQLLSARLIEQATQEKTFRPVFLDVEDSPELLKIISTYNSMFEHLYQALVNSVGDESARDIFTTVLQSSDQGELWTGVFFDQYGRFDENMLIANISELPFEERKAVLDEGLNTLLSIQLFEVSQHLNAAGKVAVFRYISDQKARLEQTG